MGDSWEDEDDDWEAADLKLDSKGDEEVWSDEEGHEAHKVPDPKDVPKERNIAPPKEKSLIEKKIEERERREREEAERSAQSGPLTEEQRRAMEVANELDLEGELDATAASEPGAPDIAAAIAAFSGGVPAPPPSKPKGAKAAAAKSAAEAESEPQQAPGKREVKQAEGSFEAFAPKTETDFLNLAKMITTKLSTYEGTKGHMTAIKAIVRAAADKMSTDDAKELSGAVSVIYNDKVKVDREKDKGKKAPKGKAGWGAKGKVVNRRDDDDDGGGGGEYDWM